MIDLLHMFPAFARLIKKLAPLLASLLIVLLAHSQTAGAITGWQAGNIMEDVVMANSSTMTVSSIQTFLNNKNPTCDTNGTQLSEFGGPDLNKDGKVQRWEWGKSNYNQTKFVCLKNYKVSDGRTAARVIYDTGKKYSINPRVLVVLLQKEQGLVQDTWPLNLQYKTATGYGCPDTAPCDSQYFGLLNQLDWAAKMFRAILDNSPSWYTPYVLGNNYIQYNPSSSCGGSTVNIQNRATQALYNYTPYQPNQGALNAGWGTASCGAYGNRNFYLYFTNWFGTTRGTEADKANLAIDAYYSDIGSSGLGLRTGGLKSYDHGYWKTYEHGYIVWTANTGAWESMGPIRDRWSELGLRNSKLGYPAGAIYTNTDGSLWQKYENGYIVGQDSTGYWGSTGSIRNRWVDLGLRSGALGLPVGPVLSAGAGRFWQKYENGYIVGQSSTRYWESIGPIRDRWVQLGLRNGSLGYPVSPIVVNGDGSSWQKYQHGYIIGQVSTGYWESMGRIRDYWVSVGLRSSTLGLPTGPVLTTGNNLSQIYQGGTIRYTPQNGAWAE